MITSSFKAYTDYFKAFATSDEAVKFFMFGGVQMGMGYAMGHKDFEYPFVWLEEPTILGTDNGSQYSDTFSGGVLFITACATDATVDQRIDALDLAFQIMGRFEKKLREDYERWENEPENSPIFLELDPVKEKAIIDPMFLEAAVGWRLELNFKLNSNPYLHGN